VATYSLTVDLTPYRLAGGSSYRIVNNGYRVIMTALGGNPTSDSYAFKDPGESVSYVFQPAGAVSDLDPIHFAPPASLPFGATKFIVRYGYYGYFPQDMLNDPAVDCTSGCKILVNQ
jgi:hypothetical protein